MRFDRGANAGVHLARASMRKHLVLEARQSGQDFSPLWNVISAFSFCGLYDI
jgi:hypothetical protein